MSAGLNEAAFGRRLKRRHRVAAVWGRVFQTATLFGFLMLVLLFVNVLSQNVNWVRVERRTVLTRELVTIKDTYPLEGVRKGSGRGPSCRIDCIFDKQFILQGEDCQGKRIHLT